MLCLFSFSKLGAQNFRFCLSHHETSISGVFCARAGPWGWDGIRYQYSDHRSAEGWSLYCYRIPSQGPARAQKTPEMDVSERDKQNLKSGAPNFEKQNMRSSGKKIRI